MRTNERKTPKITREAVMKYLVNRIEDRAEYVSYLEIGKAINKSRHAVAFAVAQLIRAHELTAYHGELQIVDLQKWGKK